MGGFALRVGGKAAAVFEFINGALNSFEPLIGPVGHIKLAGIHWAIVGGESGSGARPIREAWIDEIYAQCRRSHTAFFFKQWGVWGKDLCR